MTETEPTDLDAQALIELYFEIDDEDERELVLAKLETMDLPMVTEFWRAAAVEDDDELVQVRALAVLARRGDKEASDALRAVVEDPDDIVVFEEALRGMSTLEGPAYFTTLERIWRSDTRTTDERRAAMLVMESIDAPRTLQLYHAFIDSLGDAEHFPDDQVEVIILAFVRYEDRDAVSLLEALLARLTTSSQGMDEDERHELLGMVREGIDLVKG